MNDFTIYPAIDLRGGRVVRLWQGDPEQETHYADGALEVARRWKDAGAMWLHVVNLDGAFGDEGRENFAALARILTTGLDVQFGGGLRTLEAIRRALDLGIRRAVLGTVLIENPALAQEALRSFGPERIAAGIDARDGLVRIRGWRQSAPLTAAEAARGWAAMGGRWLIFTDVTRDGTGCGVNVEATATLARESGLRVVASGGVNDVGDVRRVQEAGLDGVIVGRALYEGRVTLETLIAQAGATPC